MLIAQEENVKTSGNAIRLSMGGRGAWRAVGLNKVNWLNWG
jgi:hypothetical protein